MKIPKSIPTALYESNIVESNVRKNIVYLISVNFSGEDFKKIAVNLNEA
jgi:hypothetical protein